MCGIAGFSGDFEAALLERMNGAQSHRGPDDSDVLFLPEVRVGFAHRRLSIIDLSPRGRQPMWDVRRRAVIVCNGELYNYRELRRELVADGYEFASDCDTEVLLAALMRWGHAALSRTHGMFALAQWNSANRTLLLARDRFGKKPLYYTLLGDNGRDGVVFASEMRAMLQHPAVRADMRIDHAALAQYLLHEFVPAPRSMLQRVRKLPAGCYAVWSEARGLEIERAVHAMAQSHREGRWVTV